MTKPVIVEEALPGTGSAPKERLFKRILRHSVFIGFHFTPLLAIWSGVSLKAVGLCVLMYFVRMFGITAGYHRYFAHRSFRTSRPFRFMLALLGTLALQKGVLWWAAHHRKHHRYSDQPGDVHSVKQDGFWWAHVGWIMSSKYTETDRDRIKDMASFPELRWLNRFWIVPFVLLCVVFYFALGFQALVWGCFISTVVLFHATFCINSLMHMVGRRVYDTSDESRNSMVLALITMGEGWHNNHHYYQTSVRQGFRWWEIDMSYYILVLLEKIGAVWDLKRPTPEIIAGKMGDRDYRL